MAGLRQHPFRRVSISAINLSEQVLLPERVVLDVTGPTLPGTPDAAIDAAAVREDHATAGIHQPFDHRIGVRGRMAGLFAGYFVLGCGGVAVFPDDVVVADDDGAVLIPQAQLDHILAEGPEQERMEAWIVNEVNNGAVLPGLYPMNAETKARYEADKKKG